MYQHFIIGIVWMTLIVIGVAVNGCANAADTVHGRLEAASRDMIRSAIQSSEANVADASALVGTPDFFGTPMKQALEEGYDLYIVDIDVWGEHDRATHNVIIVADKWAKGIRVRYDSDTRKFHFVGHWAIREPAKDKSE